MIATLLYHLCILLAIRPACAHITATPQGETYEYWMAVDHPAPNLCATMYHLDKIDVWLASVPHPMLHPERLAETKAFMTRDQAIHWINQHCRTTKEIAQ